MKIKFTPKLDKFKISFWIDYLARNAKENCKKN